MHTLQYFAQDGYAILRTDPPGNTGYGKTFRYAHLSDWSGCDYQDLMSGVAHLIRMGVADPYSIVKTGWSYGGYVTTCIVTQTHRCNAVSMGAYLPTS